jgi:hypothetical protein
MLQINVFRAANTNHPNKQVIFKPDVQEKIIKPDVKSSPIGRNNHHKQKIRGPNDDVSNRTRSKVGHIDQNVGDRTRSKLQAVCNSTNKLVFFPLYDVITFKGQSNSKIIHLKLGLSECRVYHYALLESISQCVIQFPKESRMKLILDEKIRNTRWGNAIKTVLQQFKNYQTFILLDSQ